MPRRPHQSRERLASAREEWCKNQQERSFPGMLARKYLFLRREGVGREHGKERTKARALDIRSFPLRWEMRGNQDWSRAIAYGLDRSARILRYAQDDNIVEVCAVRRPKARCHPERSEGSFPFVQVEHETVGEARCDSPRIGGGPFPFLLQQHAMVKAWRN